MFDEFINNEPIKLYDVKTLGRNIKLDNNEHSIIHINMKDCIDLIAYFCKETKGMQQMHTLWTKILFLG